MPPYKVRPENRVGRNISLVPTEWAMIDHEAEKRGMTRSMFILVACKALISGKTKATDIDEIMTDPLQKKYQ